MYQIDHYRYQFLLECPDSNMEALSGQFAGVFGQKVAKDGSILFSEPVSDSSKEDSVSIVVRETRVIVDGGSSQSIAEGMLAIIDKALTALVGTKLNSLTAILMVEVKDQVGLIPNIGERLFNLRYRPFGVDYETGMFFRWRIKGVPGSIIAQVLPGDESGKDVTCVFAFSMDAPKGGDPLSQEAKLGIVDLLRKAADSAVPLAEDVLRR